MLKIDLSNSAINVSGQFSRAELEQESYASVHVSKNENYTVDCQNLNRIDSFFVAWLIGLQRTLNLQGSRFTIQSPPDSLSRLITLYRLEEILTIEA